MPPIPFALDPLPAPHSFANTDPTKVVEFKPRGLQLPTPTSPKGQESIAEPNPGANTEGVEHAEEHAEGSESNAKLDWAEDAERTLPICRNQTPTPSGGEMVAEEVPEPTSEWDPEGWGRGWGEPEARKEEPAAEITEATVGAWTEEFGLAEGGWGTENAASNWDDPPKPAENDWGVVSSKSKNSKSSKKEKERPQKAPPVTSKPRSHDNGFRKGPVDKDRKGWGKGWKDEGLWDGKKGKKGGNFSPATSTAKPYSRTDTKSGPTKEKCRDQGAGPKDAFTFNRVAPSSSTAATPQGTKDQDGDVLDPDPLPELPPSVKDCPPELEDVLRRAVVTKSKMPGRPSVAALPESTISDKGMSWVNGGTSEATWDVDTPKVFSERKVQMDETNGWHPAYVKRSNSKASLQSGNQEESWPKLGK